MAERPFALGLVGVVVPALRLSPLRFGSCDWRAIRGSSIVLSLLVGCVKCVCVLHYRRACRSFLCWVPGLALFPRISTVSSSLTLSPASPLFQRNSTYPCTSSCQQQRASSYPRSAVSFVLPPTPTIPPLAGPGLFDAWCPACVVLCAYLCGGRSKHRNPRNSDNHKTTKPQNQRTPAADVLSSALGYVTNPAPQLRSSALSPTLRLVWFPSLPHLSFLSILSALIPPAIPTLLLLCPICCVLLHTLFFSFHHISQIAVLLPILPLICVFSFPPL